MYRYHNRSISPTLKKNSRTQVVGPSVKIHVNFSRQSRSATASLSLSCTRRRNDSLLPSIRTDWVERFRTWQPHMDSYRNREMGKTLSSHTYIASTFNCTGARKEPNSNNFEIPWPGPETNTSSWNSKPRIMFKCQIVAKHQSKAGASQRSKKTSLHKFSPALKKHLLCEIWNLSG